MALTDEQIAQERKAFEVARPMPKNCMWCGRGYAGTECNAWGAHEYAAIFKGWIERAEAAAPLLARIAALEAENHNLNWALGTEGFDQMATPEEQAEHEKGHAEAMANIAMMKARKERHDQLVPDGVDYLDHIAALTAQVEQAAQPVEGWQMREVYQGEWAGWEYIDSDYLATAKKRAKDYQELFQIRPLYAAPPKAVPLTDEQKLAMFRSQRSSMSGGEPIDYYTQGIEDAEHEHGITPATVEKG